VRADVELGGTDQLFNLNVGRDIMPAYGLEPQIVMTVPLLVGLDGVEKMSKSAGNYVGINEPPEVIVRKIVEEFRGSDEVLWSYYTLLTDLSPAEIDALRAGVARGELGPTELRYRLAKLIVRDFHGADAAERAEEAVRARHRLREAGGVGAARDVPPGTPVVEIAAGGGAINLSRTVAELGLAPSASEATRLIRGGGVRIEGVRAADIRWTPPGPGEYAVTVGKKIGLVRVVRQPEPRPCDDAMAGGMGSG